MASFLEDITPFYGTGERNGKGQTLEEFLEEYDPYRYKNPCCTTDTVVFSYKDEQALKEGRLKILLVKRGNHPSIGCWALPGGFVNLRENLEDTARRELQEETGVSGLPVEQFACYGDYQRDPRARIITSAYLSIVKESDVSVEAGDDAADAAWFEIEMEPETVYEEDVDKLEEMLLKGQVDVVYFAVDEDYRELHPEFYIELLGIEEIVLAVKKGTPLKKASVIKYGFEYPWVDITPVSYTHLTLPTT